MKIKKILANDLQLNKEDTVLAICSHCFTDFTKLARLGINHDCYVSHPAEVRDLSIPDFPKYAETQLSLNLLGNRSTDHHNEDHYNRTYSDYQLWHETERQVFTNSRSDISDAPQIYILRKPTCGGGVQQSPFTEDFVSLPKRMLRATLGFLNLQVKE